MYHIDEIELDFEPRKKILPHLPSCPDEPEMSEFESAFLCGLLKQFQPKKILEIGVAAGGTTAIIFQCMENLKKIWGGGRNMLCTLSNFLRYFIETTQNRPVF